MSILLIVSLGTLIILSLITVMTSEKGSFDTSATSYLDDDTQTSWTSYGNYQFYIDDLTGAIVVIIIVMVIIVIIGLRIWNSGLSDTSIRTSTIIIFYVALWGIFSALSYDLIASIDIFGTFIYIFLTILFVLGVFQKITLS